MKRIRQQTGFSLVEIAVVLAILSLLIGGGLMLFTAQVANQREKDAKALLALAKEALIGFAQTYGRLPCPDTDGDGIEDPQGGGTCSNWNALLPARTLGIANPSDGTLRDPRASGPAARIRYAVSNKNGFAATTPDGIKNSSIGYFSGTDFLCVCSEANCDLPNPNDCGTDPQPKRLSKAVALLIAPGPNAPSNPNGAGSDEQDNYDDDPTFVSHERRDSSAPGGEFDDLVEWLPPNLLAKHLIAAGQLP